MSLILYRLTCIMQQRRLRYNWQSAQWNRPSLFICSQTRKKYTERKVSTGCACGTVGTNSGLIICDYTRRKSLGLYHSKNQISKSNQNLDQPCHSNRYYCRLNIWPYTLCWQKNPHGFEIIKLLSYSIEHEICLAINIKIPTIKKLHCSAQLGMIIDYK